MNYRLYVAALFTLCFLSTTSAPADEPPVGALPANHRAIAVKIDPNEPVALVVVPGSRVDAIATRKLAAGKIEAKLLARNLLVVAIDVRGDPNDPKKIISLTFTVAAPAKDADNLAAEIKKGKVSLIARKPEKNGTPEKK